MSRNTKILLICFIFGTVLIYFFSNPNPQSYYDYTFRVAENLLHGRIGFAEQQPSWLNEFVFFRNYYYSVFPLGSVLTMLPFAFLRLIGIIKDMPSAFIAALTAGAVSLFLFSISAHYKYSGGKRVLMAAGILFGTWMWTNLTMAGAWHLALGFAVLGELGAIYFTVYNRRPLVAGIFFALAFGNRTEIILTAPIFMYLLGKSQISNLESQFPSLNSKVVNQKDDVKLKKSKTSRADERGEKLETWDLGLGTFKKLAAFCAAPFVLGVLTLVYNYVRFRSFTDFGYARIPGVLEEPWYRHGIFSIQYVPLNFLEMLVTPWKRVADFPYLVPTGFGGSILWSSPFVLLTLRFGARRKFLKYAAWAAIIVLTTILWTHGNPGGWQFAYRYAMVLLPWMYLILLENSPEEITPLEWLTYIVSILVNAYATYLFFWTDYVKP